MGGGQIVFGVKLTSDRVFSDNNRNTLGSERDTRAHVNVCSLYKVMQAFVAMVYSLNLWPLRLNWEAKGVQLDFVRLDYHLIYRFDTVTLA